VKTFRISNHCERPGRIEAIWKGLKTRKLDKRCVMIQSRPATKEEILLVHPLDFYERLEQTKTASRRDLKALDGEMRSVNYTNVSPHNEILQKSTNQCCS